MQTRFMKVRKDSKENIIQAYLNINLVEKLQSIMIFDDFANRMEKINNERIIELLLKSGYEFQIVKGRQEFYCTDFVNKYYFKFSVDLKGGIIIPYIYIYDDNNIRIPYDYPNLIFTYRFLINDFETILEPSTIFSNYTEFETIIKELLEIYQEFKAEFIRLDI